MLLKIDSARDWYKVTGFTQADSILNSFNHSQTIAYGWFKKIQEIFVFKTI